MNRRTETAYKAKSPGKAAPDVKARDSGDMVNAAVVLRKITALIRGDLSDMRSPRVKASCMAIFGMIRQKSAEVVVGDGKRALFREDSPRRRTEHRKGRSPDELS
jgi:hypothetical protein